MKEIDFLIIYEHKNREFESIALLKHELVKRGYTVEFFGFNEYHNKKKRKRLFNNVKIAVMPSLYKDENILTFVYGVAGKVKNIVNLRWEQLFSNATEKNLDYYVYPKENAKKAYHCCWGQKPFEMLCKAGVDKEKLFITGPIQMDFLREDLKNIYKKKDELFEEYKIDKYKKCLLFISSFSMSTMNKWALNYFYSQYGEDEKEQIKRFIDVETKSRIIITKWLIELAKKIDCTVIYRPHPAECNTDTLEEIKNKNILVIDEKNIKQWLLTCDQVYTWYSTSVSEAFVAGVPCAVLRPIEINYDDDIAIYDDFPFITDFRQFCDYYENNKKYIDTLFVKNNRFSEYYNIDPDEPSYIRTADALVQALNDNYYFPWDNFSDDELNSVKNKLFKNNLKDYMAQIIVGPFNKTRFIKRVLWRVCSGLCYRYDEIRKSKSPSISDDEFKHMEERIASAL